MLTDIIAYGAGAREAALDDEALLSRLGQARRRLAPPFAPERVDLVASVAGTLLGPQRSAASGPAAHFAFWTRRAALAKLAAGFAARVPASVLCLTKGFHAARDCASRVGWKLMQASSYLLEIGRGWKAGWRAATRRRSWSGGRGSC